MGVGECRDKLELIAGKLVSDDCCRVSEGHLTSTGGVSR